MTAIRERLISEGSLVYNGASGTWLSRYVERPGTPTDSLNLTDEGCIHVARLAEQFVTAGSRVIQTNTYGANGIIMTARGYSQQAVVEMNRQGVEIARGVADPHGVLVAASIGPTGKGSYLEAGMVSETDIINAYIPQMVGLLDGDLRPDFLHLETMQSIGEVEAAIKAAREVDPQLEVPIAVTMSFGRKTYRGLSTGDGVFPNDLVVLAGEMGLLARGANCGCGFDGARELMELLKAGDEEALLIVKLNMGMPTLISGETVYCTTPEDLKTYTNDMLDVGVNIIGLCCGSTPDDICQIAEVVQTSKTR